MADANSQPNTTPPAGGSDGSASGTDGQQQPGAGNGQGASADTFDPSKLTPEQLNKVLENQELWKNPRLAGLLESDKQLKQLQKDNEAATEKQLQEQKKFEELATKRGDDLAKANQTIQNMRLDQALTTKLIGEKVVDLDGALKLVDRSKVQIDDNGTVTGIDEALASLKTDRPYLFGGSAAGHTVGNASNPQGQQAGGSGQFKFKESQLTTEFYQAHKAEIDEAGRLGLIEADGPPPQQ